MHLAVFLLGLFLSLPWIGRPFYTRGEAREALVAQAIVNQDNWVLPRTYNNYLPSKPLFSHWCAGVMSLVHGAITESTIRFCGSLAFIIFMIGWYDFLQKRAGVPQALGAAALLFLSFEWLKAAVSARVDTVFGVLVAGALIFLFRWWERGLRGISVCAALFLAAATLTKGPAGLLLPLVIFSVFLLLQRVPPARIAWRLSGMFALPAACVSIWYSQALSLGGAEFVDKFWQENVARLMNTMEDDAHSHSVFYLFGAAVLALLPGILPALILGCQALVRLLQRFSRGELSGTRGEAVRRSAAAFQRAAPLTQFSFLIVAGFLAFFSVPESKRVAYLLPAFPSGALLLSLLYQQNQAAGWRLLRSIGEVALPLLFLVVVPGLGCAVFMADIPAEYLHAVQLLVTQAPWNWIFFLLWVLGAFFSLLNLSGTKCRISERGQVLCISAAAWCFALLVQGPILHAYASTLSEKRVIPIVAPFLDRHTPIYSFESSFYGISFYLDRLLQRMETAQVRDGYVVVFEDAMDRFQETWGNRLSYHTVARSTWGIVRPGKRVILLRVTVNP